MREDEDDGFYNKMFKVDIIFKNGRLMTSGWGNTRKMAERNASIHGLKWLGKSVNSEWY